MMRSATHPDFIQMLHDMLKELQQPKDFAMLEAAIKSKLNDASGMTLLEKKKLLLGRTSLSLNS